MSALRRDRGAAAVELALIIPMLLLVLFAAIDFGLFVLAKSQASSAARDASRIAMINPGTPGTYTSTSPMSLATGRIYGAAVQRLGAVPAGLSVTISCVPNCGVSSTAKVLVSVAWQRDSLTYVMGPVTGDNVMATSTRSLIGIPS